MKHSTASGRTAGTGRPPRTARHTASAPTAATIVERPDGYYWIADGPMGEFGPFETYELAVADRDAGSEQAIAPTTALREAERSAGVADWTDTETADPDEGVVEPGPPQ